MRWSPPGGYGRGLMAPESDIDLLFILPYKQTAGRTGRGSHPVLPVDMGLKVARPRGRSMNRSARRARHDDPHAILETRFLTGDQPLYENWSRASDKEVVQGSAAEFVTAKLAEREERHRAPGQSRLSGEPQRQGRQRRPARPAHAVLDREICLSRAQHRRAGAARRVRPQEYRTFRRCEDFCGRCAATCILSAAARERVSFDMAARDRRAAGIHLAFRHAGRRTLHEALFPDRQGRRRSHAILCAKLEDQQANRPRC